jgi:hypothetical protein
LLSVLPE